MLSRAALIGVFISGSVFCATTAMAAVSGDGDVGATIQAQTDQTSRRLGLDGGQEAAYRAFVSAVNGFQAAKPTLTEVQVRAMSTPDRMDYIASRIALHLEAERALALETRRFYAVLTSSQRRIFDGLASSTAPGRLGLEPDPSEPSPLSEANRRLAANTYPDWLVKPSSDDLSRVYPYRAWRQNVSGEAVMQCVVDLNGFLSDCLIKSESPTDWGFGNAALEVSSYMRMKPATQYGVPVRASVEVPVHFDAPGKTGDGTRPTTSTK